MVTYACFSLGGGLLVGHRLARILIGPLPRATI
jgi:hypothetical protein